MAPGQKRFSVAQVLQLVVDDEFFNDTDSDRDSLYQLGNIEPCDSDSGESGETELLL